MAYELENKLVVAVASSALFDLTESDRVFRKEGEAAYRAYQREKENCLLAEGVAFPLVKRLLSLNNDNPLVEVVLFSRNDLDTGLRVFKSIEKKGLPISRAVFVAGRNPFEYLKAFNAALFLSGNREDVKEAIYHGFPAGYVEQTEYKDDHDDELRLAFDFDGVIADDSAEKIYKAADLNEYQEHEKEHADQSMPHGPLFQFLKGISNIQKEEQKKVAEDPMYNPKIKIALCTARNAPAHERVVTTLREWDIRVDEAFFLGGIRKEKVLEVYKPHIFFDDQQSHIEGVSKLFPSVHIPYGIANIEKRNGNSQ